jgi:hypothetical protein
MAAPDGAGGDHNRGMLRLAFSRPVLWRTATSLQLGADHPVLLEDVAPWQERLLDELTTGIPDAMLLPLARSLGADEDEAVGFVRRISGALAPLDADPPRVRLETPADLPVAEFEALVSGFDAAGMPPVAATRWAVDDGDRSVVVVVVSHRLVAPARAARLVADDVAHLPIELAGDCVSVGPLVIPGVTPCLACRSAARTDDDPGWPLVAAQLLGRAGPPTTGPLLAEATVLAARLLRAPGSPTATTSADVSATSLRRVWRVHRPHARCLCRSPEGTVTAIGPETPTSAPRTSTAFARPA